MKLPFKYIAILVIVSLAGIFAYQAYWLTGLYHTCTVKWKGTSPKPCA